MNPIRQILQLKGDFVWTITPNESVFEALRLMADKDIGALLVMQDEKIVGILSERDYARKVVLLGKSSRETLVSEIMSSPVITIHPDQTVEEAMETMTLKHFRHLPVVEDDRLVGMISIGDVVRDIIYRQREKIKEMSERIRE
ncbi:CBS domain-containing protein [bacterium]|nr:MAG: CBS domain-containing protein [bacterium]